jgi:hypothetical protein
MKDNSVILLGASIALGVIAVTGLLTNHVEVTYVATGALAGVLGGHLNGSSEKTVVSP